MQDIQKDTNEPILPDLKPLAPVQTEPPSKARLSKKVLTYLDFGLDLLVIFLIVVFVRSYVIAPFQVSGASMTNTLQDQEYILVNKMLYHGLLGLNFGHPERGDIVVIEPPLERKIYYIKRVIGLPGETVKFLDNQVMIINKEHPEGFVLEESYLRCNQEIEGKKLNTCDYTRLPQKEFTVPDGSYFVMGDNRNNSTDSRYCFASCTAANATPFVNLEHIVGKTWFVVWPLGDFRTFSDQKYDDPAGGN